MLFTENVNRIKTSNLSPLPPFFLDTTPPLLDSLLQPAISPRPPPRHPVSLNPPPPTIPPSTLTHALMLAPFSPSWLLPKPTARCPLRATPILVGYVSKLFTPLNLKALQFDNCHPHHIQLSSRRDLRHMS